MKKRIYSVLLVVFAAAIGCSHLGSEDVTQTRMSLTTVKSVVIDNGTFGTNWTSYSGSFTKSSSKYLYGGTEKTLLRQYGAYNDFAITSKGTFSVTNNDIIEFDIYGGTTASVQFEIRLNSRSNIALSGMYCSPAIATGTWSHCSIPVSALGGPVTISYIDIQNPRSVAEANIAFTNFMVVTDVPSGTGGASSTGGTSSTGGSVTGGVSATGGSSETGGISSTGGSLATGGSSEVGGSSATGGVSATGGNPSTGGTSSTGGSSETGGTTAETGGASTSTGGSPQTGGAPATGGTSEVAGSSSTGGVESTGGTTSIGGAPETGGTTSVAGSSSTGGSAGSPSVYHMPKIGIGRPAFSNKGTASLINDGSYNSPYAWSMSGCSVATPCWVAVKVVDAPSADLNRIVLQFAYESGSGVFSSSASVHNYAFSVSSDSTNGSDGTWVSATDFLTSQVVAVTGNQYVARAHDIAFGGYNWLKLSVTSTGASTIDEIDMWNATNGISDTFFVHGDSITANCLRRPTSEGWGEAPSMQDYFTGYYPFVVNGGTVSQGAEFADETIQAHLTAFPMVKYWIFNMGTNDLCYTSPTNFGAYVSSWVTKVKAAGRIPLVTHPIWGNDTSSYCSNNGPSFNTAVNAVIANNPGMLPAIQLYELTLGHSNYFASGDVHMTYSDCNSALTDPLEILPPGTVCNGCNAWARIFWKYITDQQLN